MRILLFIALSSISRLLIAQDTLHHSYYDNLRNRLFKDSNVKDVKFIEKKYSNGNIKCQSIFVKYSYDKLNRFWGIGKYYCYYKNGQLKGCGNIDERTKAFRDTAFAYDGNAKIIWMSIFNNNSKHSTVSEPLIKLFSNKYYCYPDSIIDIEFKIGFKYHEVSFKFNYSKNYYDRISDLIYNVDGTIAENRLLKVIKK